MNFLRRLFGGGGGGDTDTGLYLYVRCSRCGEALRVLRKEMMDSKCFRLMYATIRFDGRKREVSREIEGGEFITREEFERLKQPTSTGS
jgi:hypothetical protein